MGIGWGEVLCGWCKAQCLEYNKLSIIFLINEEGLEKEGAAGDDTGEREREIPPETGRSGKQGSSVAATSPGLGSLGHPPALCPSQTNLSTKGNADRADCRDEVQARSFHVLKA